MKVRLWAVAVAVVLALNSGELVFGGELTWCLSSGIFCSESPMENIGSSCGDTFHFARGRVSSPVLYGGDSLTVAIKTWMPSFHYILPVYVELVRTDSCSTRGYVSRQLLLEIHGTEVCGGVWHSIGPLDLRHYTLPGEPYTIQLTFFDTDPPPFGRSTAVSCLRLTTNSQTSAVNSSTWGGFKLLYR